MGLRLFTALLYAAYALPLSVVCWRCCCCALLWLQRPPPPELDISALLSALPAVPGAEDGGGRAR